MKIYGLIGYPLKHSFSKKFFSEKFSREGIDAEYLNFEIDSISQFKEIIESHSNISGLNVTIPYKEKIIPFLDNLDEGAKDIGAVNVIKIIRDKDELQLIGYNSDIIGFQNSIEPLINKNLHKKALILGTGGASKAVYKGLKNLNIESTFVSRTPKGQQISYDNLDNKILSEHTIIVNTSPLGTFPDINNAPDIPYHLLTSSHLLYDLVYNPEETKFLTTGKQFGATTKNGLQMLELQAIAAWEILILLKTPI